MPDVFPGAALILEFRQIVVAAGFALGPAAGTPMPSRYWWPVRGASAHFFQCALPATNLFISSRWPGVFEARERLLTAICKGLYWCALLIHDSCISPPPIAEISCGAIHSKPAL